MADFPTSVVALTNPLSTDTLASPSHSGLHTSVNDELEAIETFVLGTWVDVRSHGATGDGATDDTAAIEAARDAVPTEGGIVYFPPGTYRITNAIESRGHVSWRGAGRDVTIIEAEGCTGFEFTPAVGVHGTDYWQVWTDLTIRGDYTSSCTGIHLKAGSTAGPHFSSVKRCRIQNFSSHGIFLEQDVYGVKIIDVEARYNDGDGVHIGDRSNAFEIDGCRLVQNNSAGLRILGSDSLPVSSGTVTACDIETNRDGGILADWCDGLEIAGGYIENNAVGNSSPAGRTDPGHPTTGVGIGLGNTGTSVVRGVKISGVFLALSIASATSGDGYHISLGNGTTAWARGVEIAGNHFHGSRTKDVKNNATTTSGIVVAASNFHESGAPEPQMTSGSGVLNGTTGTVITHNLGTTAIKMMVLPTAAIGGHIYVEKASNTVTVKSSEPTDTGAFDWFVLQES